MKILRRVGFFLFVAVAIVAAVKGYFLLKENKAPSTDAQKVLPDSCLIYLCTGDFSELAERISAKSIVVDHLRILPPVDDICTRISRFDSLIRNNATLRDAFLSQPVHIGFYSGGWLASLNIRSLGMEEEALNALRALPGASAIAHGRIRTKEGFIIAADEGVFLVASGEPLIRSAQDPKGRKLVNAKMYASVDESVKETTQPFLHFNHALLAKSPMSVYVAFLPPSGGASSGKLDILPAEIKLNGNLAAGSGDRFEGLANQPPYPTDALIPMVPAAAMSFTACALARPMHSEGGGDTAYWTAVNSAAMFNVRNVLSESLGECIVDVQLPAGRVAFAKITDTTRCREAAGFLNDTSLQSTMRPRIFLPYSDVRCLHTSMMNGYMLFSDSKEALQSFMSGVANGGSDRSDRLFAYLTDNLPEQFNYVTYDNLREASGGSRRETLSHSLFSLVNGADNFVYRYHLQYSDAGDDARGGALWNCRLAAASSTVHSFTNHNTGENEYVVQDAANTLYLVSPKGTVLWRRSLDGQILSRVYMVDALHNGKYQMVMNTEKYIHVIDRNGKDVHPPVRLAHKATSPVSVLDYEGRRDYRLLIACADRKIYNYTVDGVPHKGFSPVSTQAETDLPVQYVKVGASDYLVTADRKGNVYTFSRKGLGRIGLRSRLHENARGFHAEATHRLDRSFIYSPDPSSGVVTRISLDDHRDHVPDIDVSGARVHFVNLDDNNAMDILVIKDRTVSGYDLNGTLLLRETFDAQVDDVSVFINESHRVMFALSVGDHRLFVRRMGTGATAEVKATGLPLVSDVFRNNTYYMLLPADEVLQCIPLPAN